MVSTSAWTQFPEHFTIQELSCVTIDKIFGNSVILEKNLIVLDMD